MVREYLQRMAACGIPQRTAIRIYQDYRRRRRLKELDRYIQTVEAIQNGRVEAV